MRYYIIFFFALISPTLLIAVEQNYGFVATQTIYPGGISLYIKWDPDNKQLTYKSVDTLLIKAISIDEIEEKFRASITDVGAILLFNQIGKTIRQLPDQKTLPNSGAGAWDGYGYQFIYSNDGPLIKIDYNNPDSHARIMDMACLGIISHLHDLVKEYAGDLTNRRTGADHGRP